MKRKIIDLLMVAILTGSLVTGCGSTSSSPDSSSAKSEANVAKTNSTEDAEKSASGITEATESVFGSDKNISADITIWSSGEEMQRFIEGFNREYPNIHINYTIVKNEDFLAKLTPAIANGQDVPDIFTGESSYVRYLVNAGVWDDLSSDPYNADTSDVWDYVTDVGTDDSGALRALSWQTTPGTIIYRRDIAEDVLGVSEPEDVSKLLGTYDNMMDIAAKMKEKGIHMFASWEDVLLMKLSERDSPWVVDDQLVVDPLMEEFMDYVKTIHDNGYDLDVSEWDPEWTAAVEDGSVFCFVLPTWGYSFVIKQNAQSSSGKWGLCEGPNPYVNGGTWLGIYKDSPNKEAAWDFLSYMTLNKDVLKDYSVTYGEYVDLKSADEELARVDGEDTLNGQNIYQVYNKVMAENPHVTITQYDEQINAAYKSAVRSYAEGKLTKEKAIEQFKADVSNAYPDLKVQ
jgi:ABC-type glycerol-3-phosphate transport system substrate-binding protein